MSHLCLVAACQHGFKIIPIIQGLISSQDKVESFARNLARVQGVGRHSLDSAKICSKSFRLVSSPLVYDNHIYNYCAAAI